MATKLGEAYSPPRGSDSAIEIPDSVAPERELRKSQEIMLPSSGTSQEVFDSLFSNKTTDDLAQGIVNFYYSTALFDTDFALKDTDDLIEGAVNKYYSTALFDADFATKTSDELTEGVTQLLLTVQERADIASNKAASHSHTNKAILDAIDVAFTTAIKDGYDTAIAGMFTSVVAPIINTNGELTHANSAGFMHLPDSSGTNGADVLKANGGGEWTTVLQLLQDSTVLEYVPTNSNNKILASKYVYEHVNNSGVDLMHLTSAEYTSLTNDVIPHVADNDLHIPSFTIGDENKVISVNAGGNLVWTAAASTATVSGEDYITVLGGVDLQLEKISLSNTSFVAGDNINLDLGTNTISSVQRPVTNTPNASGYSEAITSFWAYQHENNNYGLGGHVPNSANSGQFLSWDGTFRDITEYSNKEILNFVLKMQEDATLDPSPAVTGDRYIMLDSNALHANFGTITGIGDNDIVEYDGANFVIVLDASASSGNYQVNVKFDINTNANRLWYFEGSSNQWIDTGSTEDGLWYDDGNNVVPINAIRSIGISSGQTLRFLSTSAHISSDSNYALDFYTDSVKRLSVDDNYLDSLMPIKVDSIVERSANNGVGIDGVTLKDSKVFADMLSLTSGETIRVQPSGNDLTFTDITNGTKTLSQLLNSAGLSIGSTSQIPFSLSGSDFSYDNDFTWDLKTLNIKSPNDGVFIGTTAGLYETGSDRFIIDNQDRTNEATARSNSLIVGKFDAVPSSQFIQFNSALYLPHISTKGSETKVLHYDDTTKEVVYGDITGFLNNILEDTTPQLGGSLDANNKRILQSQGSDVASVNEIQIDGANNGNVYNVTGTTNISGIDFSQWSNGSEIVLKFAGILTVNHGVAPNGNFKTINLAGDTNFTTSAGSILTLRLIDGTWEETSRNEEGGSGGGGSVTIQDNGVDEPVEDKINFIGFTVANDAGNSRNNVTANFANLNDVDTTGEADGDIYAKNNASGKYKPRNTTPYSKVSTDPFANITTSGQIIGAVHKYESEILIISYESDAAITFSLGHSNGTTEIVNGASLSVGKGKLALNLPYNETAGNKNIWATLSGAATVSIKVTQIEGV